MIAKESKSHKKWKQNYDVPAEKSRKRTQHKERKDATGSGKKWNLKKMQLQAIQK